MIRLLTRWDLLGISFVILVGTALHFAFAWSRYWKPMALVAPVNESVWEHFKLAFWPALLWAFLENAMRELNARAFWSAKGYALLVIPLLIATIFYGYTAALGQNIFALDIATFVIAVVATQLASAQLLKADIHTRWGRSIGISLLLCQIAVYSIFTYYPPPVGLFEDGRNGIRGIPPNVTDTTIVSGRDRAASAAVTTRSWARRCAPASWAAIEPMAPGGCGTTCLLKAHDVDCTGSSN